MSRGWTLNTTVLENNKIRKNYIHDVMYRNCEYDLSKEYGYFSFPQLTEY